MTMKDEVHFYKKQDLNSVFIKIIKKEKYFVIKLKVRKYNCLVIYIPFNL